MTTKALRQHRLMATVTAAALLLGACAGPADEAMEAPAPEPETPAAVPIDASILADPTRPQADRAEDESRKPIDVYNFFEIEPGMTVANLWPGAGYNTHLLSRAVGENGKVYAMLGFYTQFRDGEIAQALRDRVVEKGLLNVEPVDTLDQLPAGSIDAAVTVRNYHDVYGFGGNPAETVAGIFTALKPGGVVGIVDVATPHPGWHEETHRLNEQQVIDDFTAGGFELEGRSDMLASTADDHASAGFEQGRQTADRYVLKFRKPADSSN